ncbi:outer membrane protein assembly factor BamA [candidate division WOR-3 bacterium]|nr:outer membrane protein assembly factor BamA [candidate division WOR-3 bacterium]
MRGLLAIVLLASSLYADVIVEIDVEGNNRIDETLIRASSGLRLGSELTPKKIRESITRIYAMGLFGDVRIYTEPKGGGRRVIVQVEEHPRVSKVIFIGNRSINDRRLKELSDVKEGSVASDRLIFNSRTAILKEYREKGHFLTEIESKTELTEDGVIVRFFITEREKLRIKEIEIIGNEAFSDGEIEKRLSNKERNWFRRAPVFNPDKFEEDKEKILTFYGERGFPKAEITNIEFVELEKNWVRIEISMEEGTRLYFGDVSFYGNHIISEERLHKYVRFKSGDVYNTRKLQETTQKFYEIYGDMGYLYLSVDIEEELRDSIVDIRYRIEEGNPARVNYIWITGNTKTHEKVIRRELTIFPGDLLRRDELIRSQRRVFNLGFFANLTLDTRVVNDEGDIDLIFNVEEKEAGQFSVGMGYGAEAGLTGNISVSIPNLRGLGQLLYVKAERGGRVANYEIGFREPWFLDTPTSLGLHLFHITRRIGDYTDRRTGGRIEIARPILGLPFTRGSFSYGLERVQIKRDEPALESEWKSAVTFELIRDSRDNFLNPTEGSRNSIRTEIAGLLGDIRFQKYIIESQVYNRLPANFATLLRGKIGVISPGAPWYEKFLLGGTGPWGLRGYGDRSIGVIKDDEFIGGRYAALFTLQAKITFEQNIFPIVFMDIGATWDSIEEINLYDLKMGIGVGIRMQIPMMGLMGFDFAHSEHGWMPHFQIGREF